MIVSAGEKQMILPCPPSLNALVCLFLLFCSERWKCCPRPSIRLIATIHAADLFP